MFCGFYNKCRSKIYTNNTMKARRGNGNKMYSYAINKI